MFHMNCKKINNIIKRNLKGNPFLLDVRIQRAISPFVEVAHGAMYDLPESKFLASRFSQSLASGPLLCCSEFRII